MIRFPDEPNFANISEYPYAYIIHAPIWIKKMSVRHLNADKYTRKSAMRVRAGPIKSYHSWPHATWVALCQVCDIKCLRMYECVFSRSRRAKRFVFVSYARSYLRGSSAFDALPIALQSQKWFIPKITVVKDISDREFLLIFTSLSRIFI